MRVPERVLGPRWTPKELRTFYILLKAHGRQWERLEERLPRRSSAMVRALYDMHRGYLSLPEASAEGFCTIMADHYKSLDELATSHSPVAPLKTEDGSGGGLPVKREAPETTHDNNTDAVKLEPTHGNSGKKKRRLDKLLSCEQLERRAQTQLHIRSDSDVARDAKQRQDHPRQARKKSSRPLSKRAWLREADAIAGSLGLSTALQGAKFDLPWPHWFYSYVDVDFFRHNEFLDCLSRMGLAKITTAARPIWSSVRASMGRPRRLSPLFFSQEKAKLETYRGVKRQLDPRQQIDNSWPYRSPAPLKAASLVIVWRAALRLFQMGSLVSFNAKDNACSVTLLGTERETLVCRLDDVMVLESSWTGNSGAGKNAQKVAATTLLRRGSGSRPGDAITGPVAQSANPVVDHHRQEKLRAVLSVKTLLHRKEQILLALANVNERVAEQQLQIQERKGLSSGLWTTPTAFSSAVVKDLAWASSRDKAMVQQQHAWLAVNLDVTNSHLRAALLHLQSFSSTSQLTTAGAEMALSWDTDAMQTPTETLSMEQMRWAINFLASSQREAEAVVTKAATQVETDASMETQRAGVLPETRSLVAKCVSLMSVLHPKGAAAPGVAPVVTQKLLERVLELLEPRYEANMDMYAELRAAAEAAQLQLALQPPAT